MLLPVRWPFRTRIALGGIPPVHQNKTLSGLPGVIFRKLLKACPSTETTGSELSTPGSGNRNAWVWCGGVAAGMALDGGAMQSPEIFRATFLCNTSKSAYRWGSLGWAYITTLPTVDFSTESRAGTWPVGHPINAR